jgi:hypothetical protein
MHQGRGVGERADLSNTLGALGCGQGLKRGLGYLFGLAVFPETEQSDQTAKKEITATDQIDHHGCTVWVVGLPISGVARLAGVAVACARGSVSCLVFLQKNIPGTYQAQGLGLAGRGIPLAVRIRKRRTVSHGASVCLRTDEVKARSVPSLDDTCSTAVVTINELEAGIRLRIRAHIERYLAENPDVTPTMLSVRMSYTDGALSYVRSGKRGLGLSFVVKFCRATGITPSALLYTNPPDEYFPCPRDQVPKEP